MFEDMNSGRLVDVVTPLVKRYVREVRGQRVFPSEAALRGLGTFDEALPEGVGDGRAVLELLFGAGAPATVAQTGGRYFGLVNGGALPVALAARLIADAWDQNAVLHATSPVNAKLEEVVQRWLRELLGLPEGVVAGFVSGTSLGTLAGLAAARYRLLSRLGWDVNRKGLSGAPRLRIVATRQAHSTVSKALVLLGLGTDCVQWCDVDSQGRLVLESMPALDARTIVVVQAGNVNSGAFDPIAGVCERAREGGAWVHVDGAFGLWAAASPRFAHLTDGVALADSLALDAHKTLNCLYGCGVVLCADEPALAAALRNSGSYIAYTEHRDGGMYTPEMSRRARVVDLWAALRYLGRGGIGELVAGLHERALQFARELAAQGFEVLNEVAFNQVLVACETDSATRATIERLQQSGETWVGGSQWFGRSVIRISVCSWATTPEDVTRSVRAFGLAAQAARG